MAVENNAEQNTPPDPETLTPPDDADMNPPMPPQQAASKPSVDVDKLLAKVREEEKNKLYPEIEKQKRLAKELEEKIAALTKQLEEKEFNSLSQEDKIKRQVEKFEKSLDEAVNTAMQREQALTERFNKVQVDAYKEKRLRELGNTVDEEFVEGSTVEQIEASIQRAVAMAEKMKAKLLPEVEAQVKSENRVPTPQNPSVQQTVDDKITPMMFSHEEWALKREQLKRKALEGLK